MYISSLIARQWPQTLRRSLLRCSARIHQPTDCRHKRTAAVAATQHSACPWPSTLRSTHVRPLSTRSGAQGQYHEVLKKCPPDEPAFKAVVTQLLEQQTQFEDWLVQLRSSGGASEGNPALVDEVACALQERERHPLLTDDARSAIQMELYRRRGLAYDEAIRLYCVLRDATEEAAEGYAQQAKYTREPKLLGVLQSMAATQERWCGEIKDLLDYMDEEADEREESEQV